MFDKCKHRGNDGEKKPWILIGLRAPAGFGSSQFVLWWCLPERFWLTSVYFCGTSGEAPPHLQEGVTVFPPDPTSTNNQASPFWRFYPTWLNNKFWLERFEGGAYEAPPQNFPDLPGYVRCFLRLKPHALEKWFCLSASRETLRSSVERCCRSEQIFSTCRSLENKENK